MPTVTQLSKSTRQPYGGYLPIRCFNKVVFEDGITLNESENISANIIGMAVDYLTRFMLDNDAESAFSISRKGARSVGMLTKADQLIQRIKGLDDSSVEAACKLVGFDVCYRAGKEHYKPIESINPDQKTVENIRIMVYRSIVFWNKFGPVVRKNVDFGTIRTKKQIITGDGDFLTRDTLWDFKVSKNPPKSEHTLQLLIYYILGMSLKKTTFAKVTQLGIFNPRLNIAYTYQVNQIPNEILEIVSHDVIGDTGLHFAQSVENESEITVADMCEATGLKKSRIYRDIRNGVLLAHKKGNKYYIFVKDADHYIADIKKQQFIGMIYLVIVVVIMLMFLVWLYKEIGSF